MKKIGAAILLLLILNTALACANYEGFGTHFQGSFKIEMMVCDDDITITIGDYQWLGVQLERNADNTGFEPLTLTDSLDVHTRTVFIVLEDLQRWRDGRVLGNFYFNANGLKRDGTFRLVQKF